MISDRQKTINLLERHIRNIVIMKQFYNAHGFREEDFFKLSQSQHN